MRVKHFLLISVLGALTAALAPGCRQAPPPPPPPVQVLTTVYALADIVRQIGGDKVEVQWFVESGQSLDELVETPERRNQVRTAELVVTRGAADPWTLEGSGNAYQDRKILRADTMMSSRDGDPTQYMWLDPRVADELAAEITTRLITLRPKDEAYFRENAARFTHAVDALKEQANQATDRAVGGPFITLDPGFIPLARRFGMREVSLPAVSLAEPTTYNVNALRQTASDTGAGAIFASGEMPTPLLRDWETRLQMPVLALDALGTSAPSGRSTYLAILGYNLDQLKVAAERYQPGKARAQPATVDSSPTPPGDGDFVPQPEEHAPVKKAAPVEPPRVIVPARKAPSPANPFEPAK
jgi:ABC-type Zn uptake system ZnuABC Zn-binding protein ZnuA